MTRRPGMAEFWSNLQEYEGCLRTSVLRRSVEPGDAMAKTFAPQVKAVKEFGVDRIMFL